EQQRWVVHFLRETCNLGPTYHNTTVGLKEEISPEFLLARFAWAIFPLVRTFVDLGSKRNFYLRASADAEDTTVVEELELDAIQKITLLHKKPGRTRSRTGEGAEPTDGGAARPVGSTRQDSGFARDSVSSTSRRCSAYPQEGLPETSAGTEREQQVEVMVQGPATWEERVNEMRSRELKKQRVSDPALLWCNYDEAKARVTRGLPGERKFGGAYLCPACLGDVYLDEDLPAFNNDELVDVGDDEPPCMDMRQKIDDDASKGTFRNV
ncbi:MAG: hypothetical protein LQ345_007444, partial [Seirophora villosa]